ncbi:MAG: PIN domain-containing protein [Chloroflexi bacterium]|nr:PIN domain-containing protein [Chloroflexota bacterium]
MPPLTNYAKNGIMSSQVCIDANLVVRVLTPGQESAQAIALIEAWQQAGHSLIAPALLAFEVTSTLRRFVHLQAITPSQGEQAFARFLQFPIRLSARRSIFPLAWRFSQELHLPRAYDTAYLALAQLQGCDFWTADERLYNAVKGQLAWVKWVGDFHSDQFAPL